MNNKSQNLAMLYSVAEKLGELRNEFVFVGGCTTALLITETAAADVRRTLDVDCIVDVIAKHDYSKIESSLRKKGFKQSITEGVICRWKVDGIILDVMPSQKEILGFGNNWYPAAIHSSRLVTLSSGLDIKHINAAYFLATKFEAFKDRGGGDFMSSHDFEDIITVIDGRSEIISDVEFAEVEVKRYLKKQFLQLLDNRHFHDALPGHLNYMSITAEREQIVLDRIRQMSLLG